VRKEAIYKLQEPTSKLHQKTFQLATIQLFQKLKSSNSNKQALKETGTRGPTPFY
jgi:hypothetical protein